METGKGQKKKGRGFPKGKFRKVSIAVGNGSEASLLMARKSEDFSIQTKAFGPGKTRMNSEE